MQQNPKSSMVCGNKGSSARAVIVYLQRMLRMCPACAFDVMEC